MVRKSRSVDDLPTEFVRCRSFGHAWEEYLPVGKRRPEFGVRISLLCVSCGTQRHDLIDVLGNVAAREYEQPDGYPLDHRTTRPELRVEYIGRRDAAVTPRKRRKGLPLVEVLAPDGEDPPGA